MTMTAQASKSLRPVSQVLIDQVWPAMRSRPLEKAGKWRRQQLFKM